jgi:predicted metal-dependent enzyme (double-stranded beta helix superfamily)
MSRRGDLETLAAAVRAAVTRRSGWRETARLVASELERHLPSPSILTAEQRAGDPETFRSHVLHSEPDGSFSIVALVWRPGQMTCIHDHVMWGAFAVIQGVEHEELFTLDEAGACLVEVGSTVNATGDVSGFSPPGDVTAFATRQPHRHLDPHLRNRRLPARLERPARLRPPRAARQSGRLSRQRNGGLGRPPWLLRCARAQPRVTASAYRLR